MVKPMLTKPAFTLVESLFVLSILSTLLLLSMPTGVYKEKKTNIKQNIETRLYLAQSKSLTTKNKVELNDYFPDITMDFSFNQNGNINHGGKFVYRDQTCILQIGMGRFYVQ